MIIRRIIKIFLMCCLFLGGFAHAGMIPISDSIKGDQDLDFWFTTGADPSTDKVKELKYRLRLDNGEWSSWFTWNANNTFKYDGNGQDVDFQFLPVNDELITDWHQEITDENGKTSVWSANLNKDNGTWEMLTLDQLSIMPWRIPDIAPVTGGDESITIYTAVNLDLYLASNPNGFLDGNWAVGDSLGDLGLTITDGVISGLEGIYWSTTEFIFDPDPNGFGFMPTGGSDNLLDSVTFNQSLGIVAQHIAVPEPSIMSLMLIGGLALCVSRKKIMFDRIKY